MGNGACTRRALIRGTRRPASSPKRLCGLFSLPRSFRGRPCPAALLLLHDPRTLAHPPSVSHYLAEGGSCAFLCDLPAPCVERLSCVHLRLPCASFSYLCLPTAQHVIPSPTHPLLRLGSLLFLIQLLERKRRGVGSLSGIVGDSASMRVAVLFFFLFPCHQLCSVGFEPQIRSARRVSLRLLSGHRHSRRRRLAVVLEACGVRFGGRIRIRVSRSSMPALSDLMSFPYPCSYMLTPL